MQHFLLSAKGRNLSLKKIYKMGEVKAYELFKTIRWPETDGEAVCPQCGCIEHYDLPKRRLFPVSYTHLTLPTTPYV